MAAKGAAGRPPSRHPGSRLVTREPDLVRAISSIRDDVVTQASRVRREELSVAPADPARGEPCVSATFADVNVVMVYRSGHAVFFDLALWQGAASTMEARVSVPDLSLTGAVAAAAGAGGDRDVRVTLSLPDTWAIGDAHRVYVQARRVTGADATTVRVLRAWQR